MVKLSVDLYELKIAQRLIKLHKMIRTLEFRRRTPKSLTLEIHHGGWFTPTPCRSYIGRQVSSVNVADIDEFCLHDLKDMVVKLGYGVEDLMYCHFLIPSLGLDYGRHSLNVDADVLEMSKYVKDYKIILVYIEHGSSNVDTSMFDSSLDVNRNVKKEWEKVSSKSSSIVESDVDPFDGLDEILGDYANIGKQITEDESTWKQMLVHVGTSSIADDFSFGKFKEVEVEADTSSKEEESDTERNDTSGSDSEDLDYDPKHDDVFDDDEHIVEEVHVNMNNFSFTTDPKHDTSIGVVDVQEDDLDVIDYDSFGSDLDDEIDSERRIQLRESRRIGKQKNKGPNKVRVRCEGTIPALVPYVAIDTNMDKNVFSQTKGGPVIRDNSNSGKQNILDHVIKSLATNPDILVRAVQDQMQKQFKVGLSNMKAFRAKRIASDIMTGSYREQYSLLREYAQKLINQNPGTTVRIDVQQEPNPESLTRIFRRVYVCLGALKQDFRSCGREILELDGCFMSGPWPGQILTAVGVDANNGIYPVAYDIVEAESKASWCWFLNLLGEDFSIEANFNYTFISYRQKGLTQAIASVFPSTEHMYCVRHINENMKSQFKGGVYKEMLWNAAKATSEGEFKKKMGRAKCDLLINNICEVFNRQLVDGRDQPIITCLEYIREYLMKKIVLTGIPCKYVVAAIYNMSENSVGVGIPKQWVHAAYRLETWAHVYSFKVNPCNGRDVWLVVESRTVIIPPLYKPPVGRSPKKRKKSNDEIASQSASSGKLSRKGKSVSCGKCGNVGHNRKGCRGQGGGSSQAGARKVSGQAAGSRKVSGQAAGARNVSGQAAGARKASSQPSAAQSTSNQGPRQGFQGPIAGPASGSQRKTKKLVDL
ncbi:mutator type transposase [Tanacetum coccineum]